MKFTGLLISFVFLTFFIPAQAQKAGINKDKISPSLNSSESNGDELPVKGIGTFMRVKSDGEHASGYDVELWKQGDKIYGLISAHRGLMGDPPAGLLENVKFDKKTKKFSFRAKLTLGVFFSKDYENVPSREVFEFNGILTNTSLAGNLLITNELCPDKCPEKKKINLPRSKEWSAEMSRYKNYAEWKVFADEILSFRGPQW